MILPDWEFIRREAKTALQNFYAPFRGMREALADFRKAEPVRPAASRPAIASYGKVVLLGGTSADSSSGDRFVFEAPLPATGFTSADRIGDFDRSEGDNFHILSAPSDEKALKDLESALSKYGLAATNPFHFTFHFQPPAPVSTVSAGSEKRAGRRAPGSRAKP